jgi:hypothetical protein
MNAIPTSIMLTILTAFASADALSSRAENVIVVTLDGMRWQEVFGGADPSLMRKDTGGIADLEATDKKYWRDSLEERRQVLMPFLWQTVVEKGQLFGDPARHSASTITNGLKFSYPGYNELLAGFADPRIDSNDKVPNPNVTVLEWLNVRPGFEGRVAVFGSWDVLPYIVNAERSKLPVNGYGPPFPDPQSERQKLINEIEDDLPPYWKGGRFDAVTMQAALECLRGDKPRVLYVLLGETDEWAHARRYDLYLHAANRADHFIRRLWDTAQAMDQYKGKTALLITTDHGRGSTTEDWTSHNKDIAGAEYIWIAAMGPGIPALGVRENVQTTQSQFAATIAAALGEDYNAAQPKAAPPLPIFRSD